jgi:hypothetical protein
VRGHPSESAIVPERVGDEGAEQDGLNIQPPRTGPGAALSAHPGFRHTNPDDRTRRKEGSAMTVRSRRSFLKSATITGAAAGAVLLPAGPARATGAQGRPEPDVPRQAPPTGPAAAGPIVAYVKDAASGKIAVMAGEHEIVHFDTRLAAHLSRLAVQAPAG